MPKFMEKQLTDFMNKKVIFSIVLGTIMVFSMLFEQHLWRKLWVFEFAWFGLLVFVTITILVASLIKRNWKVVFILTLSLLISGLIYLSGTEVLKSEKVLEATLADDLNLLSLILRADQTFELIPQSWMGDFEEFSGEYKYIGNKIIFLDKPYRNEFIPDTVLIYKDKIILNGDISRPDTSFANFFNIRLNKLNTLDD